VIGSARAVVKGKHGQDLKGGELQESERNDGKELSIGIDETLFDDVYPVELIKEIINQPGTESDRKRKDKEKKLFFPEEAPIFIKPEKKKTECADEDPIGKVTAKAADET